ncbi:MAG: hypothetical protein RLZZ199_213, partial [Actinomycetota bacterium]
SITKADGSPVTDVFGNAVTTTTTDANGNYSFDNLPLGQYKVTVTPPAGYFATKTGAGTSATDSSTGSATSTNLTTDGARDASLDFGFVPRQAEVSGEVWKDVDGDGTKDKNEPGLPDVPVELTKPDGTSVTDIDGKKVPPTKTDEDGKFTFANVTPGKFEVTVTPPAGLDAPLGVSVSVVELTASGFTKKKSLPPTVAAPKEKIPVTGSDLAARTFVALMLIFLGWTLSQSGRRRVV